MLRLIFITTLFIILPLQTIASTSYIVRIAVYNNADSLQQKLNELSPTLRKTVRIQKRGEQHVACSIHTENKATLKKLLPSYKKVFPDAFISTYQTTKTSSTETNKVNTTEAKKISETKQITKPNPVEPSESEVEKTTPQITQKTDYNPYSRKIVNPTKKNIPLYNRFHQKTLYLCAYGEEEWLPNVLIHIAFFDNDVIYTPIMGDISSKQEKYTTEDNKLYISQKGVFDLEVYSTLEKITLDYYLISTWIKERKVGTIRYYFDLEKAEAYIKTLK